MRIHPWTLISRSLIVVCCWSLYGEISTAQSTMAATNRVLSLQACLDKALADSPLLGAAAFRRAAAQGRREQSSALPNPRVEFEMENFGGTGPYNAWEEPESTLGIRQEIELGGKRATRHSVTDAEYAIARTEYESILREVIRDTRQAFIFVLLAQEKTRLAEAALHMAHAIEKTTVLRAAAGKTTSFEADRLRMETARMELARDTSSRELRSALQALAGQWGASDETIDAVEGTLENAPMAIPPFESISASIRQSPDFVRWDASVHSALARVRMEKTARIPNIEISAGARHFNDSGDVAFVAGIGMDIPVFDRNAGHIRATTAEADAVRMEAVATQTALILAVRRLHAQLLNQKARIESLRRIGLPAAEKTLAAVQTAYREGKLGYLELLDAQRAHKDMREEYAEALADFHAGLADLQRWTETDSPLSTVE